jgi:hypothetical protein
MRKTLVAALLCSASVVGVGTGSAFAGEVTGNGKGTPFPSHGPYAPAENVGIKEVTPSSICAYSGQNDEYHADPDGEWPRVQSWGQDVKAYVQEFGGAGGGAGTPGEACRGN